jgi:hypothetical protein
MQNSFAPELDAMERKVEKLVQMNVKPQVENS